MIDALILAATVAGVNLMLAPQSGGDAVYQIQSSADTPRGTMKSDARLTVHRNDDTHVRLSAVLTDGQSSNRAVDADGMLRADGSIDDGRKIGPALLPLNEIAPVIAALQGLRATGASAKTTVTVPAGPGTIAVPVTVTLTASDDHVVDVVVSGTADGTVTPQRRMRDGGAMEGDPAGAGGPPAGGPPGGGAPGAGPPGGGPPGRGAPGGGPPALPVNVVVSMKAHFLGGRLISATGDQHTTLKMRDGVTRSLKSTWELSAH